MEILLSSPQALQQESVIVPLQNKELEVVSSEPEAISLPLSVPLDLEASDISPVNVNQSGDVSEPTVSNIVNLNSDVTERASTLRVNNVISLQPNVSQDLVLSTGTPTESSLKVSRKKLKKGIAGEVTSKNYINQLKNTPVNLKRNKTSSNTAAKKKVCGDITNQQLTAVSLQVCPYPPYLYPPSQFQGPPQYSSPNFSYSFQYPGPTFPTPGYFAPSLNPQLFYPNISSNVPKNLTLATANNATQNTNTLSVIKHKPKITVLDFNK